MRPGNLLIRARRTRHGYGFDASIFLAPRLCDEGCLSKPIHGGTRPQLYDEPPCTTSLPLACTAERGLGSWHPNNQYTQTLKIDAFLAVAPEPCRLRRAPVPVPVAGAWLPGWLRAKSSPLPCSFCPAAWFPSFQTMDGWATRSYAWDPMAPLLPYWPIIGGEKKNRFDALQPVVHNLSLGCQEVGSHVRQFFSHG